ncbi:MAG: AsmA family protein, partial [Sphingomonadales bacterium]|nr:AsmA family protein [Sphingomonadales bacterium]
MRYDDNGVRPKLSGTLSIDGLPLSRFLGNSSTGATAVKAAGGRRWSRNPFELNWMREIDIDIGFDGQEISYDKYRYMEPQFKARLENGVLNITDFKGKMFGGRVLGQLRMDVNNVPKGSVAITMEEASLKQALEASAAISPATGSLSLRSDVSFSGISQYDAVSSLNGNVEIWAQNGVIKGIDIDRISRRLARLNSLPDFLSLLGNSLGGGETPFGNIRTNFVGERGVFSARNITADIEGADVDGRMRLDLPQWTMTGTGSIKFNEVALPATAPQTREVRDATGQITIEEIAAPPVRDVPPIGVDIAGDIDNPTINYRTDRLRAFMGERFASSLLDSITGGEGGIGAIFGIPTPTQTPTQTQPQEAPAQEPEVDPVDPAGRVDPADVIIDTLLDLLQPRPQPEQTPDDD